jgi:hypothetical protein
MADLGWRLDAKSDVGTDKNVAPQAAHSHGAFPLLHKSPRSVSQRAQHNQLSCLPRFSHREHGAIRSVVQTLTARNRSEDAHRAMRDAEASA